MLLTIAAADVTEQIARIDRRYVDVPLEPFRGYAAPHTLTLDVAPVATAPILLLTAWTDYAFSSDVVAAHQAGLVLRPPLLQARDAGGRWRTIVKEIGIPVGRPQTVTVDLSGRLLPGEHEVRIVTNMRNLLGSDTDRDRRAADHLPIRRLDPMTATLHARGFAAEVRPDGHEPPRYDYARVTLASPWKVMQGRYTREGDVRALLVEADDKFVIAKPGDEIAMSFDAAAAGPLPDGWTRTFLLLSDGFSKEMDINSASPDRVEPLPFHAMTAYPYRAPEHYPDTPDYQQYQITFNTPCRPAHGALDRRRRTGAARRERVTMEHIRYSAAACQTDMPNPLERRQMYANTDRMLSMIDSAVAGSAPFLPVRLVVFPEFAHAAPVFQTVPELLKKLTVPVPNEHTVRLAEKAREHDLYIQSGSMLEEDPRWPGVVFNTSCFIGPEGVLARYRKVNTWIPYEVQTSPPRSARLRRAVVSGGRHADRPHRLCHLLRLAVSGSDPSAGGERRRGARTGVGLHGSVGRDRADGLVDAHQSDARHREHRLRGRGEPGRSLKHYPPYSWPGGSQVVDFDGRLLANASPGPGERIVVAPIDVSALRHERQSRVGHHMLAHLRTEAYDVYRAPVFPSRSAPEMPLSYEENVRRVESAKDAGSADAKASRLRFTDAR